MRCDEIMKHDPRRVSPQTTVETAAAWMRDGDFGFLPVCDETGVVLGAITDRDIAVRVVATGMPTSTPVSQVMTPRVVACRPDEDLERAEELMQRGQVSRIVCVDDDGRLRGVLSLSDIAQADEGAGAIETLRQVSEREVHF
jgi:CBS domain-containing protein